LFDCLLDWGRSTQRADGESQGASGDEPIVARQTGVRDDSGDRFARLAQLTGNLLNERDDSPGLSKFSVRSFALQQRNGLCRQKRGCFFPVAWFSTVQAKQQAHEQRCRLDPGIESMDRSRMRFIDDRAGFWKLAKFE